MTNKTLSYVLRNLKLKNCKLLKDNIYYIKKAVKQMCYNRETGKYSPSYSKYEFLIIAEEGIKKAIILNCGDIDLHWYVFKKWRGQQILSNALRTGIIKTVWPNIKTVTCCYDYGENKKEKYKMTKHLASLAKLKITDEETIWTN